MRRPDKRRDLVIAACMGVVMAIVIGIGGSLMLREAEDQAIPELSTAIRAGTDAVGQAVADLIGKGLGYGIPLEDLYGVDAYFDTIVTGVPTIDALALAAPDGETLWSTRPDVQGASFPVILDGNTLATIVVAPAPPFFGAVVFHLRAVLAGAALLFGFLGGCLTYLVLSGSISAGRERLRASMRAVIDGTYPSRATVPGSGVVADAMRGFERQLAPLETAVRGLEDEVATVRAIDFDGSLSARLEPILQPLSAERHIIEDEDAPRNTAAHRLFAVWLSVVILGVYWTVAPFVANFAIDRQWAWASPAWWPSLPWVVELAVAVTVFALARTLAPNIRPLAAFAGLLATGAACASVYVIRDYDHFLLSRAVSGLGLGLAVAAMTTGRGTVLRDRSVAAMLVIAVLIAGPLLGGLLGEAIGRRMSFLSTGVALMVLAFLTLSIRWPALSPNIGPDTGRRLRIGDLSGRAAGAGVAIGVTALVLLPAGVGYDAYFAGGALIGVIGLAALLSPAMWQPLAAVLILAGLAVLSLAPEAGQPVALYGAMAAGCALLGAGAAGFVRRAFVHRARKRLPAMLISLATGLGLGAAAASLSDSLTLPPLAIPAGFAVLLSLLDLPGRRTPGRQPDPR